MPARPPTWPPSCWSSTTDPGERAPRGTAGCPTRSRPTWPRTGTSRCCWRVGTIGRTVARSSTSSSAFPLRRLLLTSTFETLEDLAQIDLDAVSRGEAPDWPRLDGPLFGVCTHGRHDACCAERGRPVAAALTASHPDETWEISHMGGDRFAANMVVLPGGALLRPDGPRLGQPGGCPARGRAASTWPGCAGVRRTRCTCSTPRSRCAATSRRTDSTRVRLVRRQGLDLRVPARGRRVGGHRAPAPSGTRPS